MSLFWIVKTTVWVLRFLSAVFFGPSCSWVAIAPSEAEVLVFGVLLLAPFLGGDDRAPYIRKGGGFPSRYQVNSDGYRPPSASASLSVGSFGRKRPSALNLSAMALVSCAAFGPVEGKFAYSQDCGFRSHTYLLNCVSDGIYLSADAVFTMNSF